METVYGRILYVHIFHQNYFTDGIFFPNLSKSTKTLHSSFPQPGTLQVIDFNSQNFLDSKQDHFGKLKYTKMCTEKYQSSLGNVIWLNNSSGLTPSDLRANEVHIAQFIYYMCTHLPDIAPKQSLSDWITVSPWIMIVHGAEQWELGPRPQVIAVTASLWSTWSKFRHFRTACLPL